MFGVVIRLFCVCSMVLAATTAGADESHVLIINSYNRDYAWTFNHNAVLVQELEDSVKLDIHDMNCKEIPFREYPAAVEQAWEEFMRARPDAVVLTDDFALKELGSHITGAGTPVIYLGVNNNPRAYMTDMSLATGVLEGAFLRRSISRIQRILPGEFRSCLVMLDSGITSQAVLSNSFQGNEEFEVLGTRTKVVLARTYDQWKQAVLSAGDEGHQAIILGLYHALEDPSGERIPGDEVALWTNRHSPVPLFAFWDFAVGKGRAAGGLVLDAAEQGEIAAGLVRRVLNGEPAGTIHPVTTKRGRMVYSEIELRRWGLLERFRSLMLDEVDLIE